jgi:hypothetical protein
MAAAGVGMSFHARWYPGLLATVALVVALGWAGGAAAANTDKGTVKVHEAASENPEQQNDPHVSCDFFIEGFHIDDTSGTIVVKSWPPTGDGTTVLTDTWTGTAEATGTGDHFNNGPYNLSAGHYKVFVFGDAGHPGNTDHALKTKVFWVDQCGAPCTEDCQPPPVCTDNCQPCTSDCGGNITGIPCPTDLAAVANADGSVTLTWDAVDGATSYHVLRATDGGALAEIGTTAGTTFTDTSTVPGTTYRFSVLADDGTTSEGCEVVEVTAVPELPGLAMGVAAVGGVAVFAVLRRW